MINLQNSRPESWDCDNLIENIYKRKQLWNPTSNQSNVKK
jgi:hypothetical protein